MTSEHSASIGSKKELWLRLRNYHFEHLVPPHLFDSIRAVFSGSDASTQAFADKLARKLSWDRGFALRAIGEYKKFVYLGVVSNFPVTPPRVIDQVWHEHLLFSSGYREFCAQVLGRNFDHHPELVPTDEQTATFRDQYAATLELYEREFDREAPEAFWGTPKFSRRKGHRARPKRNSSLDLPWEPSSDDTPLHAYFDGSGGGDAPSTPMPEFGGGESGGAGGGGEWGDSGSDGHAGSDGSDGHGSDGGSDSGGSDGGSGCSSGCSGGD